MWFSSEIDRLEALKLLCFKLACHDPVLRTSDIRNLFALCLHLLTSFLSFLLQRNSAFPLHLCFSLEDTEHLSMSRHQGKSRTVSLFYYSILILWYRLVHLQGLSRWWKQPIRPIPYYGSRSFANYQLWIQYYEEEEVLLARYYWRTVGCSIQLEVDRGIRLVMHVLLYMIVKNFGYSNQQLGANFKRRRPKT